MLGTLQYIGDIRHRFKLNLQLRTFGQWGTGRKCVLPVQPEQNPNLIGMCFFITCTNIGKSCFAIVEFTPDSVGDPDFQRILIMILTSK
jgi:hypothetical protein